MDWKELLSKFRLAEIKAEGKQVGVINVTVENKTENKTYNFNFYNKEAGDLPTIDFKNTPEFEKKVSEEAERRLINLGISPDFLSESTRAEIARMSIAVSGLDTSEVNFEGKVLADVLKKT